MKRDIITDPNPILREPAQRVENFDMELQTLIDDMIETMRADNGVGLAAPQVGISRQILVCELESEEEPDGKNNEIFETFPLTVVCNPEIIHSSQKKCKIVEGCLSFPGLELVIERPESIVVRGQDRYGQPIEIKANKLFARVLQHEIDHLRSTLFTDHLREINVIVFAGGNFALKPLEYLANDQQYKISQIITTSQLSKSRGIETDNNQVKKLAQKLKIKVRELDSLYDDKTVAEIKTLKADLGIVVDFGLIIPQKVIDIFKYKIVNIHPSLLPKYRGSSPIQATILNGDRYAGVTLMQINEQMDAGPVISQYKVKLKGKETFPMLKDYLSDLGATIMLDALPYYISKEIQPKEQNHKRASYTKKIEKKDGEVKLSDEPITVERKIRAYQPWPGVFLESNSLRVVISAAHFDKEKRFIIDRVKPAGKNEMSYRDFINGYRTELTFGANIDIINAK